MAKAVITPERAAYIKANWQQKTQQQMADAIGVSKYAVGRWMLANGMSVGKDVAISRRAAGMKRHHAKTAHLHDDTIRAQYLLMNVKKLARHIGKSHGYVIRRIRDLGLKIPDELIAQRKQQSRIQKGNVPLNKGKKWDEFMTPEGKANSLKTTFKKGNVPHNAKEADGTISIRKDSEGRQYKWIRVSLGKWVMLHVHMWEQVNGPVPEGHIVIFKDKNGLNCTMENLECISRAEHAIRCRQSYLSLPEDMKEIVMLTRKLKKQINKHEHR